MEKSLIYLTGYSWEIQIPKHILFANNNFLIAVISIYLFIQKHIMKRFSLLFSFIIISFSTILNTGCKKDTATEVINPTVGYKKLASGYAIGAAAKVEIWATDSFFTGYNKLYIALLDSTTNTYLEDAHIMLTPTMQMMGMSHSAPYEDPTSEIAVNKLFPCSVTFIMSSMGGTWTLDVQAHNHKIDKEGTATFTINVKDPTYKKLFSFTSLADNSSKYFVGLVPPTTPIVGINDFEFVVYKKQTMTDFPADSSLTATFVPTMPTMGHSSPNNVNPVHIGNGHYKGKMNFTMTGLWQLNTTFHSGSVVADSTHYFEVNF